MPQPVLRKGAQMERHGHDSLVCQEMQPPGDSFLTNTLSTTNLKVGNWKRWPDQELVIRALDKKTRVVGIGTRATCGRETKEEL